MIRTKREYEAALKKLEQNDEALSKQRSELERLELSQEDIVLAMSPLVNFRNQLQKEIKTYEGIKRRDWDLILNLADPHHIGRFLIALQHLWNAEQKPSRRPHGQQRCRPQQRPRGSSPLGRIGRRIQEGEQTRRPNHPA